MKFNKLSKANKERSPLIQQHFDIQDWSLGDWCTKVGEEYGEVCRAIIRIMRGKDIEEHKKNLGEELADLVVSADLLACHAGINLEEEIKKKFNSTSDKYGINIKL